MDWGHRVQFAPVSVVDTVWADTEAGRSHHQDSQPRVTGHFWALKADTAFRSGKPRLRFTKLDGSMLRAKMKLKDGSLALHWW